MTLPRREHEAETVRPAVVALALASAGWAALVLRSTPEARILVPAVFAAGIGAMGRWPVLGATVVCAGQAAGLVLGTPDDSPAGLVAGLAAMTILGRRSRSPWALVPVLAAWAVIVATDLSPVRQVLGLALFGAAYGVGVTVRRSAESAAAAEAQLRELEAVEVATRARVALEVERRRLTERSARLVATATAEMKQIALDALSTLDPTLLASLRARGDAAVDELRRMLTALRDPDVPAVRPPQPRPVEPPPWREDALTALVLGALAVAVRLVDTSEPSWPVWLGLTIAAVALRRTRPGLAVVVAATGFAAQWATGHAFVLGPAIAVATALVVWSAVGAATVARWGAVAGLATATALATAPSHDGSLEVALAIVAGTTLASHLWHRIGSARAVVDARAGAYSRQVELAVAAAAAQERLAVARDLHDVASGSIAVMMLHTSVAAVTREADPEGARAALERVVVAGDRALEQLGLLDDVLRPQVADDPSAALAELVARAQEGGLDVHASIAPGQLDAGTAEVAWRVVNEGLTNALKHAHGARVDVAVRRVDDDLHLAVVDDGPGPPSSPVGTRWGLRGLEELVARRDGSLHSGPRPDRGFELRAVVPVARAVPADREAP